MRPILFDTNIYVSFKKGSSTILEIFQQAQILAISPIVIGELKAGFEGGNNVHNNNLELNSFLEIGRIKFLPISTDTSRYFAQIYNLLKRKGKPIPTNDMWIAAQALEHGCIVCTLDKHFGYIDGLVCGSTLVELT